MLLPYYLLITPGEQKRYHHLIRDTSRRSLSLARSNRDEIMLKKKLYLKRIESAEEYIGLLRQECALLDIEIADADDEVTTVRGILNKKAIAECSLSDNEDGDFIPVCPPPSSDPVNGDSPASSSCSHSNSPSHYGSESDFSSGDEIEVVGEWALDKKTEGGIGPMSPYVAAEGVKA